MHGSSPGIDGNSAMVWTSGSDVGVGLGLWRCCSTTGLWLGLGCSATKLGPPAVGARETAGDGAAAIVVLGAGPLAAGPTFTCSEGAREPLGAGLAGVAGDAGITLDACLLTRTL